MSEHAQHTPGVHTDATLTNAQRFMALYVTELRASMERKPENFALRPSESIDVEAYARADKMVTAIIRGHDVNVSDTMRRVARKLGVGTTRAAIFAYVRS